MSRISPIFDKLTNEFDHFVLKIDHFEEMEKIATKIEGAPNWRKVSQVPVFGSAQPTRKGVASLLDYYLNQGVEKVLWVSMRSEPVVYIDDFSFTARLASNTKENLMIEDRSKDHISTLNCLLKQTVKKYTDLNEGKINYYRDTFALLPEDRQDTSFEVVANNDVISTFNDVITESTDKNKISVHLLSLPVNDAPHEKVPDLESFDFLVDVICRELSPETIIHCNCQMGRGRTTAGLVLCSLVYCKREQIDIEQECEKFRNEDKIASNGYYSIVSLLLEKIPGADEAKYELDAVIFACSELINIRDFIWTCKEKGNNGHFDFWHKVAVNYVERYFYLILFTLYLTEVFWDNKSGRTEVKFSEWCKAKEKLFVQILGRKPGSDQESGTDSMLETFKWD